MPKSKSKSNVRAVSSGGLPRHPALQSPHPLLRARMGDEEPVRLPDEYLEPTCATTLVDDFTLTPNADGDVVIGINHRIGHTVYTVTTGTVGATYSFTNASKYTAFTTAARFARTVLTKVSVTYIGAEQTSAGYLSSFRGGSVADIASVTMNTVHNQAELQVRATDGFHAVVGHRAIPTFEVPTATSYMQTSVPILFIAGSGLPAVACLKVRVVRFVEYVPVLGDLLEGESKSEPLDRAALDAHGQMGSSATTLVSGAQVGGWRQTIMSAANAAYHVAQPVMSNYIVPRARQYLQGLASESLSMLPMLTL